MNGAGRLRQARAFFETLVEKPEEERQARLRALKADDPDLAAAVAGLLEADAQASGFLERTGSAFAEAGAGPEDATAPEGERIGPYRVLTLLGRGGMGEVYLAERADGQFEQKVALKLVKRGMDTEEILERFYRERQILARLSHPNIARLLDGGRAPDGRPFFVLEYVDGEPLTGWAAARKLPVAERLGLARVCCDAVDAAHRNLVVHRDLKPSNILVTRAGEVKLLDFGIAKLLGGEDADATVTEHGFRVLTPAYAAPELIAGEAVTTATDVYSLGVVFYELLTGTLPFAWKESAGDQFSERLRTEVVERPSARARRAAADEREGRRLARALAGDLDTILLTALRREPERRYPSAAALGDDLRRHVTGLPVRARAETFRYRAGKFLSRHRAAAVAGTLLLVSLVGGLAGTAWQARRAAASAKEASAQSLRATRVKEFLITLFEVADPEQSGGEGVTARQLLEQGTRRLRTELAAEPLVQADLLEAVARINKSLGLLEPAGSLADEALALRRERLPAGDPSIASGLATLGAVRMGQGKLDEAERQLREALTVLEAREPARSLALARVRSDYGQVLFWKGKVEESERLERQVYETCRVVLGSEHVQTAIHLRNLGVLLEDLDRLDEAELAYRDSQGVLERHLGQDHAMLGQSYLNMAVLLNRRERPAEAEPLYRRALENRRKTLGLRHPATGQTLQLFALFLLNRNRLDESEAAYHEGLELFLAIDPKHFEVGKCRNGLGLIASRRGDHTRAEAILREVVAGFRESFGEEHAFVWLATGNLALEIALQGRLAEAETRQREVVQRLETITGPESSETAEALGRLADTLRRRGAPAEAVPLCRRSLAIQTKITGGDHPAAALAAYRLGAALAAGGEAERAEAQRLLTQAAARLEKAHGRDDRRAWEARAALAALDAPRRS